MAGKDADPLDVSLEPHQRLLMVLGTVPSVPVVPSRPLAPVDEIIGFTTDTDPDGW